MTGEWIFWRHLQKGKSLEKTTWTVNSVPYKVPCKKNKKTKTKKKPPKKTKQKTHQPNKKEKERKKKVKEKLQGPGWFIAFLQFFPWSLSSQILCSLPLQKALLVFQQLYQHYHFCLCLLRDWLGKKLHTGSNGFSCFRGKSRDMEGEGGERQLIFKIRTKVKKFSTEQWSD